jgi:hypothetical protein
MAPDSTTPDRSGSEGLLRVLLGSMSIFTLVMTVPQAWTVWVSREVAGVSLWSWGAYLLSALLWFWFGLKVSRSTTATSTCLASDGSCWTRRWSPACWSTAD